ncbi:MAG: sulfotransferase [Phycisphaerales bacterium]
MKRDAMDTCLSCFFQNFTTGMEFTYDLATIGAYYNQYARLMRHWESLFPGAILDLNYEDLVDDLEAQSRRVLEDIGLPWNDACLRFHEKRNVVATMSAEQVRRPIYKSSVKRWTNYEKHLGLLRAALQAE